MHREGKTMNFRMIGQVVGRVLCIEAALMLLPMIAAVIIWRVSGRRF